MSTANPYAGVGLRLAGQARAGPGVERWGAVTTVQQRLDLLIVSNGHGEDAIGARLGAAFRERRPELALAAFPLVGPGEAYRQAGIALAFRSRPMPSGGFGWQDPRAFVRDVAAGFLSLTAAQMDALRRLRERVGALLLVGDIYPVLMTLAYRVPRALVATARSDYISPHLAVERRILARACRVVFARDEPTARSLARDGVPAVCVGNVMMDMVEPSGLSLGLREGAPVVGVLPGSRQDWPDNLLAIAGVLRRVREGRPDVQAVAALAGPLPEPGRLGDAWELEPADEAGQRAGLDGWLVDRTDGWRMGLSRSAFGDVLARADLVVGLAGTANEQAAGLGRVVVAFARPGVQYTRRFALRQKRLLGDALVLADGPEQAAREVLRLLDDPQERLRRGEVGRQRMGPPGATRRVVAVAERVLGLCPDCPKEA